MRLIEEQSEWLNVNTCEDVSMPILKYFKLKCGNHES